MDLKIVDLFKMSRKPRIEVIKIETARPAYRPKRFPPQPIMYLELIENKEKIKHELVNKNYVPPPKPVQEFIIQNQPAPINFIDQDEKESFQPSTPKRDDIRKSLPEIEEESDKENSSSDISDSDSSRPKKSSVSSNSSLTNNSSDESMSASSRRSSPNESSDSDNDFRRSKHSYERNRSKGYKLSRSSRDDSSDSDSDDGLSSRIKMLLKKDRSGEKKPRIKENYDRYSIPQNEQRPIDNRRPPTLSELENQGVYQQKKVLRDISQPTGNEMEEEDLKRELLYKFDLLKKSYGNNISVPEFSIHSDYQTMLKSYESTLKRVSLDSSVDNYKTYLIGGFMLVEFVLGNWFKLDMQGFSQQQIMNMNNYEKLLIELGEKSYVPNAKQWPVEVRLLFMIIINAGFFIITKMLMKKTGANLFNMINSMGTSSGGAAASSAGPKRKMKGPDINLGDIPDL
jgi:hypothetical protein